VLAGLAHVHDRDRRALLDVTLSLRTFAARARKPDNEIALETPMGPIGVVALDVADGGSAT
jgi:hypothetical protein